MGLVQAGLGKMRPQERHVELAAVESDQQRELRDVGGELVEVDALDEQGQLAAAQRADQPSPGRSRRKGRWSRCPGTGARSANSG